MFNGFLGLIAFFKQFRKTFCLFLNNANIVLIALIHAFEELTLFLSEDSSKFCKMFLDPLFLFFGIILNIFNIVLVHVNYAKNRIKFLSKRFLGFLQTGFDFLYRFTSCLHLVFSMGTVDCTFRANWSSAAETEICQFFFRVALTHVERLHCPFQVHVHSQTT